MSQPILQFIEGIDPAPRELTQAEITALTAPGVGKGDWFAQWLAKTPVSNRQLSLRSLLNALPAGCYTPFIVADGTPIVYNTQNPSDPLNSVSRHVRFAIIALPDYEAPLDLTTAILTRTLCIVGSSDPDGTTEDAFLQCASWDPNALGKNLGLMRFYQRNEEGWVFFGDGFNAFNPATSGYGPFDGHVGGSMIMKELTIPWTHWYNVININEFEASLGSTRTTPSLADPHNVLYDPLFTPPNGAPFSLAGRAEDLEPIVEVCVSKWYISRFRHDFIDPTTKQPFQTVSAPIKQWVAHILLSRSMNIAASATTTAQVQANSQINGIPTTMFFNSNALQVFLPGVGPSSAYVASNAIYTSNVGALELSLYYDDFSTDPPTRYLAVPGSEGPFAWPIIEPGVEDYQAMRTLTYYSTLAVLLPNKAIAAMLMVDFYNPIYSARRESLFQYVPETAEFNSTTKTYNVLEQFTANVSASAAASDPTSAEYEVLQLLATPDDQYVSTFTTRVNTYLANVGQRFTSVAATIDAVGEYMILAEGRRRLYKGFEDSKPDGSGLDEFRLTLPIAALPNPFPITRMKETGDVETVPLEEVERIERRVKTKLGRHANTSGGCPAHRNRRPARLGEGNT